MTALVPRFPRHAPLFALLLLSAASAQELSQSVTLLPGWNSVWVEVQPADNETATVFAGIPVESAWTWLEPETPAEFIQSVSEAAFSAAGWQRWFPPGRNEAVLNNLFRVQANRAYLIKLGGSSAVNWTLTGRPSLRRPTWTPDAFSLRGLPVDPATPVSFRNFLRPSAAHYDEEADRPEAVYRLNRLLGEWQAVGPTTPVTRGEAYWIFSRGASDFLAPLDATVEFGDGLDFGAEVDALELQLENGRGQPGNAILRHLVPGEDGVLSHYDFDPAAGGQWLPLPDPLGLPIAAGDEIPLRLAPRRQDMPTALQQGILEVRDGAGTLLRIPTSVESAAPASAPAGAAGAEADPLAGLWVGVVALDGVSEAHSTNPSATTPTDTEFRMRVLLHVDAGGGIRLLKEVVQMWRPGTFSTGPDGVQVVEDPGRYVLVTDPALLPQFDGAAVRDGESVGRRLSSVAFDFAAPAGERHLALGGSFAIGQTVSGTLSIPSKHPTNPFLHRYHPDHDNQNVRFDGPAEEAYEVERQIAFDFLDAPPDGPAVPDFGYNAMGGNYRETITGIHKNPIHLAGTFRLTRISKIAELNPAP